MIGQIVLICSFFGILIIIFQKIPLLLKFSPEANQLSWVLSIRNKASSYLKAISACNFLKKSLLKFKLLTLKTENRTSNLIEKLQGNNKNDNQDSDKYWNQLKDDKPE